MFEKGKRMEKTGQIPLPTISPTAFTVLERIYGELGWFFRFRYRRGS